MFHHLLKKPERPFWEGIWDATAYKPACPQHLWYVKETVPNMGNANMSEDCLYMNIFAPRVRKTDTFDLIVRIFRVVFICSMFFNSMKYMYRTYKGVSVSLFNFV